MSGRGIGGSVTVVRKTRTHRGGIAVGRERKKKKKEKKKKKKTTRGNKTDIQKDRPTKRPISHEVRARQSSYV